MLLLIILLLLLFGGGFFGYSRYGASGGMGIGGVVLAIDGRRSRAPKNATNNEGNLSPVG